MTEPKNRPATPEKVTNPWVEVADKLGIDPDLPEKDRVAKAQDMTTHFAEERDKGKKRDTAIAQATSRLKKLHPADFKKILNEELVKVGMPTRA